MQREMRDRVVPAEVLIREAALPLYLGPLREVIRAPFTSSKRNWNTRLSSNRSLRVKSNRSCKNEVACCNTRSAWLLFQMLATVTVMILKASRQGFLPPGQREARSQCGGL
jgi:hypothetical protein